MKSTVLALSTLAVALLTSQVALAAGPQLVAAVDSPSPISRAEVKAETRAAEMALQIPRGEAAWPGSQVNLTSTVSRAQVKAQTKVAEAEGLIPRGEQSARSQALPVLSTVTRAEVKADTRRAEYADQIPRGESNVGQSQF